MSTSFKCLKIKAYGIFWCSNIFLHQFYTKLAKNIEIYRHLYEGSKERKTAETLDLSGFNEVRLWTAVKWFVKLEALILLGFEGIKFFFYTKFTPIYTKSEILNRALHIKQNSNYFK